MAKQSTTQLNCCCWLWFLVGLGVASFWVSGFYAASSVLGCVRIEPGDDVACRIAHWRLMLQEQEDLQVGPETPENTVWRLTPTDPN